MADFSSSGVGSASAAGAHAMQAVGSSSGASSASSVSVPKGVFSSAGSSFVTARPSTMDGTSVGSSTATGMASSAIGNASGTASTSWVAALAWSSLADEVETLIGAHGLTIVQSGNATSDASPQTAVYASSGTASDAVELLEKRRSVGAAAGSSTAAFLATLEEVLVSSGAAADSMLADWRSTEVSAGEASNELDVVHRRFVVGRSVGASSAIAQAVGGTNGVGTSVGTSTVSWMGRGVKIGTAVATGAASALAILLGVAESVGVASGSGSAAGLRRGRQVEILVSSGEIEDALQFPAPSVYPVFWSNTIEASGATWEGLPFNSMIEVDGVIYAAGTDGLYQLEDLSDDDGTDISANIEWDLADRSDYKQRTRSIYVHAIADGPFTVKVGNKQGEFSYQTHLLASSKMVNHRAALGRGVTSRAMRLSLQQTRYFSVSDVNLESGDTTRRI